MRFQDEIIASKFTWKQDIVDSKTVYGGWQNAALAGDAWPPKINTAPLSVEVIMSALLPLNHHIFTQVQ